MLAGSALAAALLSATTIFDDIVDAAWPPETSAAVERARGRVFAEMRHADRLLWQSPALAGRVAFDARFELLSREQVERIDDVLRGRGGTAVRDYDVFVIASPSTAARLQQRGFRVLTYDSQTQVLVSAPSAPEARAHLR